MNRPLLWIVGGAISLGLITWMAFAIASEPTNSPYSDPSIGWGEVTVDGDFLPPLPDEDTDPAMGTTAATISGADWNGNAYSISPDGRPKVVMFLAHWCPHCQAEVPEIQAWIDAGLAPTDVDLYSITSLTNPTRTFWPPQEWLQEEGWTVPTIMDDQVNTAANAYGLSGTPFYVVLDGQNNVLLRVSGRIGIAALEQLVAVARSTA